MKKLSEYMEIKEIRKYQNKELQIFNISGEEFSILLTVFFMLLFLVFFVLSLVSFITDEIPIGYLSLFMIFIFIIIMFSFKRITNEIGKGAIFYMITGNPLNYLKLLYLFKYKSRQSYKNELITSKSSHTKTIKEQELNNIKKYDITYHKKYNEI